jgi:hypothetical protein
MYGPSKSSVGIFEQPRNEVLDEIFKGVDFGRPKHLFNTCSMAHNVSLHINQVYEDEVGRLEIE